jgi:putative ATPase
MNTPHTQEPLASRIRPLQIEDFVGQSHLMGTGKPLRVAIEGQKLFSFILWGPPGSGKTTLARMYASALGANFFEISAVDAGKEDMRTIIGTKTLLSNTKPKILFVDEIHRFSKAQQDFLLPFVERGDITLIGATTENPSFEIIAPLLSRCRVFVLKGHSEEDMRKIIARTKVKMSSTARDWLVRMSTGDARQAITLLETVQKLYGTVTLETLQSAVQSTHLRYDKKGEEHYNTVSAFIKSMRASQADAALYYLARMVEAGEDPLFIARRMVIFASEDIGIAQPTALVVANAVFHACEIIGYPECAINLAHGVAYLAESKKSRAAYDAYLAAVADVTLHSNLPIPMHIRNAPTKLMKDLKYGDGYKLYDTKSYLPHPLQTKKYLSL